MEGVRDEIPSVILADLQNAGISRNSLQQSLQLVSPRCSEIKYVFLARLKSDFDGFGGPGAFEPVRI